MKKKVTRVRTNGFYVIKLQNCLFNPMVSTEKKKIHFLSYVNNTFSGS